MSRRPALPKPPAWDGVLALVILLVETIVAARAQAGATPGFGGLAALPVPAWIVLVTGSGAISFRRHRPLTVLCVVVGAYGAWHLLGYPEGPSLAVLMAMYGVGRYVGELRTSLMALAAPTAAILAAAIFDADSLADLVIAAAVVPFLPWYIGRRVAARSEHLRLLEERADLLERKRAAELRQVLEEERRSIARELHDVVAHRVSLMTVQAGAAQAAADIDPSVRCSRWRRWRTPGELRSTNCGICSMSSNRPPPVSR